MNSSRGPLLLRALLRPLLGRSTEVPASLVEQFAELRDIRFRRGGLPPRVGGWLLGQRSVAAVTLWRTVFLAPDVHFDAFLLLHEARHVQHFAGSPLFPLRYTWASIRHGYRGNPYEADANFYAQHRLRGGAPLSALPPDV